MQQARYEERSARSQESFRAPTKAAEVTRGQSVPRLAGPFRALDPG